MPSTHKSGTSSHDTPDALSSDDRKHLSDTTYAFPKQRKEPLNDASHVRNAIARFDQVKDVSDAEREEAFRNINTAAKKFGVEMKETHWRETAAGRTPRTRSTKKPARGVRTPFVATRGPSVGRHKILFATSGSATRSFRKACERPPHAQWARPAGHTLPRR